MIIVIATAQARPDKRNELSGRLAGVAAASRDDPGCLDYRFYADVEDPTRFASIETWTDRAAHDAHMGAAHVTALLSVLGELVTAAPVISVHEVSDSSTYG